MLWWDYMEGVIDKNLGMTEGMSCSDRVEDKITGWDDVRVKDWILKDRTWSGYWNQQLCWE